ncbi:MAG: sugar-binding domain-containing protein [Velocimicrobium sp.]
MGKRCNKTRRFGALLLAFIVTLTTALGGIPPVAMATDISSFIEVTGFNGDFENGLDGWTVTKDGEAPIGEDYAQNSTNYFRTFINEWAKNNKTTIFEAYNKEDSTGHTYKLSREITGLTNGTYYVYAEAAGANDSGGILSMTLDAGEKSVALSPTKWDDWIHNSTDTFEVTDGTLEISVSMKLTKQYVNLDNIKLFFDNSAAKVVDSVQPLSVKTSIGQAFTVPSQASVLFLDGTSGNYDVIWDTTSLGAIDLNKIGSYNVQGKATVNDMQYDVQMTVNVVEDDGLTQDIAEDAQGSIDFDSNWKFYLATRTPVVADSGFATGGVKDAGDYTTNEIIATSFNDLDWRTVDVPHDFSIEGNKTSSSNDSQAYLQGGLAYYRKSFKIPAAMSGSKRISIDFEGVYQNCIVYLNGQEVGNYPSGYTGFAFDITDKVNYGGENILVVKVQNMSPSGRWYTGSGITRPVHLMIDNLACFNRNGITLTTPDLATDYPTYHCAELNVTAEAYSDASNANVYLQTTIYDANGTAVTQKLTEVTAINPSTAFSLSQKVTVDDVALWYPWNLGTPYLYTVKNELYLQDNGGDGSYVLVDTDETEYGFRWIEVKDTTSSADSGGLYVNGLYTKIQGVDLHHDSGALGAASYTDAYERQFDILMDMGVNAYRTSHCPPSKQVIEVCRRKGILVVEEAFDGWGKTKASYDFGNFFFTAVPTDWAGLKANGLTSVPKPAIDYSGAVYTWSDWVVSEMVNRDKNEPSIIAWSIGNEVRGTGSKPSWYDQSQYDILGASPTGISEYTEAVRLLSNVDAEDSTRLVIMGGDQQRKVLASTNVWGLVNQVLDGYGLNYNTATSVDGLINRYSIGDGSLNANGSKTFFFESESSSQTSSRGVYLDAKLSNTGINLTPGSKGGSNYDNDFASWTMSNEYGLKKDRDRKSFIGEFIWSGFDYLGEPTPYGIYPVGVSSFGTIDTAGFAKDSFYLYKSQWTKDPMVHIVPGDWDLWREGEVVDVWVNTNVQTAELFLNGKSLGKKSFDEKKTAYGKKYYETSEATSDDKTWGDSINPGGYTSTGAVLDEGETNYGKLHLTWEVPYEAGVLEVKAYDSDGKTVVATDSVTTSSTPYTIQTKTDKTVLAADGTSLSYIECTIVDKDGNMVADADNLVNFSVTGSAIIVGVDNGQQENTELYKYGNMDKNTYSERTAYHGKVLVILKSEKAVGDATVTISADNLKSAQVTLKMTTDGTGEKPVQPTVEETFVSVEPVNILVPNGVEVPLPAVVKVNYDGGTAGSYSIMKAVTWSSILNGKAEGSVEGIEAKATATLTADHTIQANIDLAENTALWADTTIFKFDTLATNSTIRNGAIATASFTGSTGNYPNNMLLGDDTKTWSNAYTRGKSVLLDANSASRKYEYVTFMWDKTKVFNTVELSFVQYKTAGMPSVLEVQYWNGTKWVAAANQSVGKATVTKEATVMKFDTVATDKVRVYIENETPYTANGNIEIAKAAVRYSDAQIALTGLTLGDTTTKVGEKVALTPNFAPIDATNKKLTWTSSDNTIATVVDGELTAWKEGTVTITATSVFDSTISASCTVTIKEKDIEEPEQLKLTLDITSKTIEVGEKFRVTPEVTPKEVTNKSVTWTTSDQTIATVENGVVTAVKVGKVSITATSNLDTTVSTSCEVIVVATSTGPSLPVASTTTSTTEETDKENSSSVITVDIKNKVKTEIKKGSTIAKTSKAGIFYDKEGSKITNAIVTTNEGVRYIVDEYGKKYVSAIIDANNGNRYITSKTGAVVTGTIVEADGAKYYTTKATGKVVTNKVFKFEGEKYVASKTGELVVGKIVTQKGAKYYTAEETGRVVSKELFVFKGKIYYAQKSGKLAVSKWVTIRNIEYYCNRKGNIIKTR